MVCMGFVLSYGYIALWSTLSLALALTIEYTVRLLKTTVKDPVHFYAAVICSYNIPSQGIDPLVPVSGAYT